MIGLNSNLSMVCTLMLPSLNNQLFILIYFNFKNTRKIAWETIDDKIFFAGEAYHPVIYATLPGALETAEMAVHNILYKFKIL